MMVDAKILTLPTVKATVSQNVRDILAEAQAEAEAEGALGIAVVIVQEDSTWTRASATNHRSRMVAATLDLLLDLQQADRS
ncbi:MAG: hypothetical protein KGL39_04990 [Patescibacteria group bacterium]|nr:hypothetical protein [Patescibacteria group bacterium]